jgi:hypothetical protein
VKAAVEKAAEKHGAIEIDDVYAGVKESIKVIEKDGEFIAQVVDDEGEPLEDSKGKPITVDAFVEKYLDKRPHLKKSDFKGGKGSGPAAKKKDGEEDSPFTKEQLNDPQFVMKNRQAIRDAIKSGKLKV